MIAAPSACAALLLLVMPARAGAQPADCVRGLEGEKVAASAPEVHLWLERCLEAEPEDEVRVKAKKALRRVVDRLRQGKYAEVSFISEPDGASLAIAARKIRFTAPQTMWLPYGVHEVAAELAGHHVATQTIDINSRDRVTVVARLQPHSGPIKTGAGSVDFEADPPPAATTTRKQQAEEFDSLLPDRFGDGQGRQNEDERAALPSRWPVWAVAIGVAVVGGGVAAQLASHERLAISLYAGGGALVATGATGLVLRW